MDLELYGNLPVSLLRSQMGFIEYNGKLSIHSSLLNVILHD